MRVKILLLMALVCVPGAVYAGSGAWGLQYYNDKTSPLLLTSPRCEFPPDKYKLFDMVCR
jgi:hypothetical protein